MSARDVSVPAAMRSRASVALSSSNVDCRSACFAGVSRDVRRFTRAACQERRKSDREGSAHAHTRAKTHRAVRRSLRESSSALPGLAPRLAACSWLSRHRSDHEARGLLVSVQVRYRRWDEARPFPTRRAAGWRRSGPLRMAQCRTNPVASSCCRRSKSSRRLFPTLRN